MNEGDEDNNKKNFDAPEPVTDDPIINEDKGDDSHIQQRLSELEDEIIDDATPDEAMHTKLADDDESLSESEIQEQLDDAQTTAAAQKQNQLNKITELYDLGGKDLALEEIEDNDDELECLNCSAPLRGPYCHNCGQPDRHFIRFFPKVLWDMINEAFDLDSRALRTLFPLLFSPGRLSMEYIAGRRARYVNPLRLYIILSVLFFISISLFTNTGEGLEISTSEGVNARIRVDGDTLEEKKKILETLKEKQAQGVPIPDQAIVDAEEALSEAVKDPSDSKKSDRGLLNDEGELDVTLDNGKKWHVTDNPMPMFGLFSEETTLELNQLLWTMGEKLDKAIKDDPSELIDEFFNAIPQLMFILLPIFALLLKITYIFKKRYYMEHLIVALHSHCFIFFSLILLIVMSSIDESISEPIWLKDALGYLSIALAVWIPLNIYITQKRIYAQGYFFTTVKFIFVGVAYSFLLAFTSAAAFVVGLATL
jgi:hypothetical protein